MFNNDNKSFDKFFCAMLIGWFIVAGTIFGLVFWLIWAIIDWLGRN